VVCKLSKKITHIWLATLTKNLVCGLEDQYETQKLEMTKAFDSSYLR